MFGFSLPSPTGTCFLRVLPQGVHPSVLCPSPSRLRALQTSEGHAVAACSVNNAPSREEVGKSIGAGRPRRGRAQAGEEWGAFSCRTLHQRRLAPLSCFLPRVHRDPPALCLLKRAACALAKREAVGSLLATCAGKGRRARGPRLRARPGREASLALRRVGRICQEPQPLVILLSPSQKEAPPFKSCPSTEHHHIAAHAFSNNAKRATAARPTPRSRQAAGGAENERGGGR